MWSGCASLFTACNAWCSKPGGAGASCGLIRPTSIASWRPSSVCPCVQAYSGAADPNCRHCDGKGHRWGDALATQAGIVSHDTARKYAPQTILDAGDVMLVIPSDQPIYQIGEFDRVVMTDRTEPFSLNLIAGVNAKLRFTPTTIDQVAWIAEDDELVEVKERFFRDRAPPP